MTLTRLLEMLRQDGGGADAWPVLFTGYKKQASGEWKEVARRDAITSIEVDHDAREVLLVRESSKPPLSLMALDNTLAELAPQFGDFTVDTCEPPIDVEGAPFRVDIPVVGAGRDVANKCVLVVYAS